MNNILNEKYRPRTLSEMITSNIEDIEYFENILKEKRLNNHILLYGNPGTGKTTLSKIIINVLNADAMWINASLERGIDVIKEKVVNFSIMKSMSGRIQKIIQLEEFDNLTSDAYKALRPIMEEYSKNVLFIATCNYVDKIPDPILSRFEKFEFKPISKNSIIKRTKKIMDSEGIKYTESKIEYILKASNGDMRTITNLIQKHTINGIFEIKEIENLLDNFLKAYGSKSKQELHKFFYENSVNFDMLYRLMWDKVNTPEKLILIAKYMNSKRTDDEITFCSLCCELWNL
jgi:replication factor C small subunit